MVEISIIIPTYNRTESLNTCVQSILASGLCTLEIIIVNDHKDGKAVLYKENESSLVRVVNNPKKGVASARNYGAGLAISSKLIFVDDDMILNRDAIVKAVQFLDTTTNGTYNANWVYHDDLLHVISKTQFGRYLIGHQFTSLKGWNNNALEWKENALIKANGITSQFLAVKKKDFLLTGGYNEYFPHAGFEDYELNTRFKALGFGNFIDTNVLIYHNEIDRLEPLSWLQRQGRGAETRKVAVEMGFTELSISYQPLKKVIYTTLSLFRKPILFSLKFIPNRTFFDPLYFKWINVLLGITIYVGYHSKK